MALQLRSSAISTTCHHRLTVQPWRATLACGLLQQCNAYQILHHPRRHHARWRRRLLRTVSGFWNRTARRRLCTAVTASCRAEMQHLLRATTACSDRLTHGTHQLRRAWQHRTRSAHHHRRRLDKRALESPLPFSTAGGRLRREPPHYSAIHRTLELPLSRVPTVRGRSARLVNRSARRLSKHRRPHRLLP